MNTKLMNDGTSEQQSCAQLVFVTHAFPTQSPEAPGFAFNSHTQLQKQYPLPEDSPHLYNMRERLKAYNPLAYDV
jgi:hypothetical protein